MSAGAKAPAKQEKLVRRSLVGGPWGGRGISVPEARKHLECGYMSGMYRLQKDGTMAFGWHTTRRCERPYGAA